MHSTWEVKQPFGICFKFLITLFILVTIPLVSLNIWVNQALAAPSNDNITKTFVIKEGENPSSFSQRLQKDGIIKHAFTFRVYLKISGLDRKIQAGSFSLATNKPATDIAKDLTTGRLDKWITLIEGLRKEEVAAAVAKKFNIDKEKFIKQAVEGYLFPDTYLIPLKADEEKIILLLKDNFDKKFTKDKEIQATNKALTQDQVITIASIIERETKNNDEKPTIAGIVLKRWREDMMLGIDATVQYALGYSEEEKVWWRKNLTEEDLKIKSPFNTRIFTGLPPGPICSPGLASIEAVINAVDSPYYFYIHDKEGKVHYARTFQEHLRNIEKYPLF